AGNRVNAATHAKKMPVAAIGPKDWFELRSETNKHSRAMATVAADAVMAPKEAFHEAFKESATDSVCCNSSLWRATRSSEESVAAPITKMDKMPWDCPLRAMIPAFAIQ